jgi:hypothetical protein
VAKITPFGIPSVPGSQTWLISFSRVRRRRSQQQIREGLQQGKDRRQPQQLERPQDRAGGRFYAASTPSFVFNLAARQVAVAQGKSLSENARALALLNMASNDSLVASFGTKYYYLLWRPETAIRAGDLDGNAKTDPDFTFVPFIVTPCFPSYPRITRAGATVRPRS